MLEELKKITEKKKVLNRKPKLTENCFLSNEFYFRVLNHVLGGNAIEVIEPTIPGKFFSFTVTMPVKLVSSLLLLDVVVGRPTHGMIKVEMGKNKLKQFHMTVHAHPK